MEAEDGRDGGQKDLNVPMVIKLIDELRESKKLNRTDRDTVHALLGVMGEPSDDALEQIRYGSLKKPGQKPWIMNRSSRIAELGYFRGLAAFRSGK